MTASSPPGMVLGPVTLLDCLVFCIFLAPQLIWQAGLIPTLFSVLEALPFLLIKLPIQMVRQRRWASPSARTAFTRGSTVFEDFIVRCVRWSFVALPVPLGRVFFHKWVVLPFVRWRMLRHGYPTWPVRWNEYASGEGRQRLEGIWVTHEPECRPDIVVYYVHGGGFALGSAHFYLEFTLVLQSLLLRAGYANPAIFNIEYTLVPDGVYPTQLHEVVRGYEHVLSVMGGDASKICVAGDSAGGTLILSLLQVLGAQSRGHVPEQGLDSEKQMLAAREASLLPTAQLDPRYNGHTGTSSAAAPLPLPGMVTLISPWITLMSNALFSSSGADFLDPRTLRLYAREYAGEAGARSHPASPGCCLDEGLWKAASPQRGYFVIYGEDEVFASDIENFVKVQGGLGIEITAEMIEARVHAWPVASLFASSTEEARLGGLRSIVSQIRERIR